MVAQAQRPSGRPDPGAPAGTARPTHPARRRWPWPFPAASRQACAVGQRRHHVPLAIAMPGVQNSKPGSHHLPSHVRHALGQRPCHQRVVAWRVAHVVEHHIDVRWPVPLRRSGRVPPGHGRRKLGLPGGAGRASCAPQSSTDWPCSRLQASRAQHPAATATPGPATSRTLTQHLHQPGLSWIQQPIMRRAWGSSGPACQLPPQARPTVS